MNEQGGAVAPFHRPPRHVDPDLSQLRDDRVDRRGVHGEAEVVHPDGMLRAGRRGPGRREDVQLLAPHLHDRGSHSVGARPRRAQQGEPELPIEVQGPVHVPDLEPDMIEGRQPQHERLSVLIARLPVPPR